MREQQNLYNNVKSLRTLKIKFLRTMNYNKFQQRIL